MNALQTIIFSACLCAYAISFQTSYAAAGYFVEVVHGCTTSGTACAKIRGRPSATSALIKEARIGVVLEVDQEVHVGEDVWYRIRHDTQLRYPERVTGRWYIHGKFVRVLLQEGKQEIQPRMQVPNGKKIVVTISEQNLVAYENDEVFLSAKVSTGLKVTPTPRGVFTIFKKQPSRYMQGPLPYISQKYYDLPGVPWTMYFTEQGAAIHGAYWHTSFGKRYSSGCVNLPPDTARILYEWAELGTLVVIK